MKNFSSILLICIVTLVKSQVNIVMGLKACYSFAGNANDAINSLNGQTNNITLTTDRNNIANEAYQFNGTANSKIILPNDPLLKPTNYLSFSSWIFPNVVSGNQYLLFTKNPATTNFEAYSLSIYQNKFTVTKGHNGGPTSAVQSTATLTPLTWYHVAFTMGNDSLKLYVNGILNSTNTTTLTFNYSSSDSVILGATNESSFPSPFSGKMDNIRFYDRKLNSTEVNVLYNQDPACSVGMSVKNYYAKSEEIKLYPNPTTDKLFIETMDDDSFIEVINSLGHIVFSKNVENNSCTLDLKYQDAGIYFLKIKTKQGISVKKIVKE